VVGDYRPQVAGVEVVADGGGDEHLGTIVPDPINRGKMLLSLDQS
jgi:hypothetical protein